MRIVALQETSQDDHPRDVVNPDKRFFVSFECALIRRKNLKKMSLSINETLAETIFFSLYIYFFYHKFYSLQGPAGSCGFDGTKFPFMNLANSLVCDR